MELVTCRLYALKTTNKLHFHYKENVIFYVLFEICSNIDLKKQEK